MVVTEYDYDGEMSYYQNQPAKKGIAKEMSGMDSYIGLAASGLQGIADRIMAMPVATGSRKGQ